MERPVYLRDDAYRAVIDSLSALNAASAEQALRDCGYTVPDGLDQEALTEIVLEVPSRYLYERCNILARGDLLSGLFIEFNDEELDAGHTYLIDEEAAEEIASGELAVLLRSGRAGAMVPRARIERAFVEGCLIDYRESR